MTDQLDIAGFCPVCQKDTRFIAKTKWYRGSLNCVSCDGGSVPRERALALELNKIAPNWRDLAIHESSPMKRGISPVMQKECKHYVGSHFFPEKPFGSVVEGWQNENLEDLTFKDNSFDLTISLDVMEHIFNPGNAFREIYRTLKPGGFYLCTFPIRNYQVEPMKVRARLKNGEVVHEPGIEPEYHGNPISGDGALVTVDYGYDVHHLIQYWTDFDVCITRYADRHHGILGAYTEVICCRKPS